MKILLLLILVKSLMCCNTTDTELVCDGDEEFSYNKSIVYTSISWFPSSNSTLNSTLDLIDLQIADNFVLNLKNLKGFDLINPFALKLIKDGSLHLKDSDFEFYNSSDKLNRTTCQDIIDNEIFVSAFDIFNHVVSLESDNRYSKETCPIHFKNLEIETFQLAGLSETNILSFIELNKIQLNSTIRNLEIHDSNNFILDKNLFTKQLFEKTNKLKVDSSNLMGIQGDLFSEFYNLRSLELKLNNFGEFIKNMLWLNSLNVDLEFNSSNQVDSKGENETFITLTDLTSLYEYPNEEICLFKDFPHNRFVFPIINTKSNLNCTFTLMWLLQNKDRTYEGSQKMETDSTRNCLTSPDFNKLVEESKEHFEKRNCLNKPTTTTITTTPTPTPTISITSTITNPTDKEENSALGSTEIALIVVSVILACFTILGLGFGLFKMKKDKNKKIQKDQQMELKRYRL